MAEKKQPRSRYLIITDNSSVGVSQSIELMSKQINEKITQGYVPFGNLAVTSDEDGNPSFYQPMILKSQGQQQS